MQSISILGCGWLGFELAKNLIGHGASVKGSTTTPGKLKALREAAIDPYLIDLAASDTDADINDFLSGNQKVIINFPPKISSGNFILKAEKLISPINESDAGHVIFISSTSVYGEIDGEIDEDSAPVPSTEAGKQLLAAEIMLRERLDAKLTIIRPGGLIGPDRHPVNSLSGKTGLANPLWPVNLVHRQDLINMIISVLNNKASLPLINAVAPTHPSRIEFYTAAATLRNIAAPGFNHDDRSTGKIVRSIHNFKYTNPIQ